MNNKATKKEFVDMKVSFGDIRYIYPYNIWCDAIHNTHDEMFQINPYKLMEFIGSDSIKPRTRAMIFDYYIFGMTKTSIAEKYFLSPCRIQQILSKAQRTLRFHKNEFLFTSPELNPKPEEIDKVNLGNLHMSVRLFNCLKRAGYNSLKDLVGVSIYDINKIRNLGQNCLKELYDIMNENGYFIDEDHIIKERTVKNGDQL